METDWFVYKETRRELRDRKPRVLLTAEGVLRMNAMALGLLGDPKAIGLLFDVQKSRIGIRAESPELEYALPLRIEKKSTLVHIGGFCRWFNIRLESTIEFSDVRIDNHGVMMLDLTKAKRRVG